MGKKILTFAAAAAVTAVGGGAIVAAVGGSAFAATAAGTALATAIGTTAISVGLTSGLGLVGIGPKVPEATLGRLNLSFDPDAPRKLVFGETALATDMLYSEPSGEDQEFVDYIIAVAAHRVESIDEIWLDDQKLWTAAGGVQGVYAGYASVIVRTEGSAANAITINSGAVWNAADCHMTGCAYIHLRIKRIGNDKKATSPFVGGLTGRMTIKGKGIPCYDPRKDDTRGGFGPHRADDQDTWEFTNNHALHTLTALLGWRINGELSVGGGVSPDRIDMADFIMAANICDEDVALADGGTQKRYEGGGVFSDEDATTAITDVLCQAMHAELRDVNGRIGVRMKVNDLSGPMVHLGPEDVLGAYTWTSHLSLHEAPNIIRGRFTDPSDASLFQMVPASEVRLPAIDGNNRALTLDLPTVQDPIRARRILKQALLRARHGGSFEADFGFRAWGLRPGDPVLLTFPPAGIHGRLFRVARAEYRVVTDEEGARQFCPMTLEPDDPAVYAWDAAEDDIAPDAAIAPVSYDPTRTPLAIVEGEIPEPIIP